MAFVGCTWGEKFPFGIRMFFFLFSSSFNENFMQYFAFSPPTSDWAIYKRFVVVSFVWPGTITPYRDPFFALRAMPIDKHEAVPTRLNGQNKGTLGIRQRINCDPKKKRKENCEILCSNAFDCYRRPFVSC